VDHGVGGGQVEAGAAGLERDEEDGDRAGLEALDQFAAVLAGAGEDQVRDPPFFQQLLDQREHRGELGEQQDPAALLDQGVEQIGEFIELGGGGGSVSAGRREEESSGRIPEGGAGSLCSPGRDPGA
jgi:hypothetical protein